MVLDVIKDAFAQILQDVGVIGWLVIGAYAALFACRVLYSFFGYSSPNKSELLKESLGQASLRKSELSGQREEIRIKIDEINLRLAQIKLAKEEALEAARLEHQQALNERQQQAQWEKDIDTLFDDEQALEEEWQAAIDEMYTNDEGRIWQDDDDEERTN